MEAQAGVLEVVVIRKVGMSERRLYRFKATSTWPGSRSGSVNGAVGGEEPATPLHERRAVRRKHVLKHLVADLMVNKMTLQEVLPQKYREAFAAWR